MHSRVVDRIDHMLEAIVDLKAMMDGRSIEALETDRVIRAAFERFLEIISEASRHVPAELQQAEPTIPWRRVADLGNHLRHTYDRIESPILWNIYAQDLDPLAAALSRIRAIVESSQSE